MDGKGIVRSTGHYICFSKLLQCCCLLALNLIGSCVSHAHIWASVFTIFDVLYAC